MQLLELGYDPPIVDDGALGPVALSVACGVLMPSHEVVAQVLGAGEDVTAVVKGGELGVEPGPGGGFLIGGEVAGTTAASAVRRGLGAPAL